MWRPSPRQGACDHRKQEQPAQPRQQHHHRAHPADPRVPGAAARRAAGALRATSPPRPCSSSRPPPTSSTATWRGAASRSPPSGSSSTRSPTSCSSPPRSSPSWRRTASPPGWPCVIIVREIAVSVLRIVGVSQGVSIPADKYGKLKTVCRSSTWSTCLCRRHEDRRVHPRSADVAGSSSVVDSLVRRRGRDARSGRAVLPERPRRHPHARDQRLMPPGAPRAAVVLSGNELLDGRTRDTNGSFVCDDLSRARRQGPRAA